MSNNNTTYSASDDVDNKSLETQRKFGYLLLKDTAVLEKWITSQRPSVQMFDANYHLLLNAITEIYKRDRTLLTRLAFKQWLEARQYSKLDVIGNESVYNQVNGQMFAKAQDHGTHAEEIVTQYRKRVFKNAIEDAIRDNVSASAHAAFNSVSLALENECAEHIKQGVAAPDLTIDASKLPTLLQQYVGAMNNANPRIGTAANLGVAFAVCGAMIGKHYRTVNERQLFYPNLWSIVPIATGANKTGTLTIVGETVGLGIRLPTAPTAPALIAELGKVISAKEWQRLDATAKINLKKDCETAAKSLKGGRLFAVDEATHTLSKLCGGYDSKSPAKDIELLLQLADSGATFDEPTISNGGRLLYDSCVSFIGFTQLQTWCEWITDEMKMRGVFGRVLPSCAPVVNTIAADLDETVKAMRNKSDSLDGYTITVDFGTADTSVLDPIGDVKRQFRQSEIGQYFTDVYHTDFQLLENKLVSLAIRMAMICAWADNQPTDTSWATGATVPTVVDGSRWFAICHDIAAKEFLAYLCASTVEAFTTDEIAFIEVLKRKGTANASEVKRNSNRLKKLDVFKIKQVADGLIQSGDVIGVENCNGVQYRLKDTNKGKR